MTRILILPGLGSSGPDHWQTLWEQSDPRCVRVEQRDWENPLRAEWCAALQVAVEQQTEPVLLVAHSLACVMVAHWAKEHGASIVQGALLVAPADVDSEAQAPKEVRNFAPMPMNPLPFPSVVVASQNDPYMNIEQARACARAWGSRFVDVGELGHINGESQLGAWPEGKRLLNELSAQATFALDEQLRSDTILVGESTLNLLLLMNDRRYPWLVLVPKRAGLEEIYHLSENDRRVLLDESCAVAHALREQLRADKVNVGALGNVVRQLHVHHVGRTVGDAAWPGPVWGHSAREPYSVLELERMRAALEESELAELFTLR